MVVKHVKEFINITRETYHNEEKNAPFDTQTALVCVLGALSLLLIQFIAKTGKFISFLRELGLYPASDYFRSFFTPTENGNLIQLVWFASFSFFFYLVFPLFIMRIVSNKRPSDFGLKIKGAFLYGKFYLIFMAIMFPAIVLAATFPSFQAMYPFYQAPVGSSIWPNILIWEIFYLLQFLGTEFFFRGFLIHGLKHRFGFYSIFISVIPYCMIHFQKPFLEAFGSIIAGLILGMMSLRTNSVIMGTALHFGVALTMDICALMMS
jgi:uncharacterized protein